MRVYREELKPTNQRIRLVRVGSSRTRPHRSRRKPVVEDHKSDSYSRTLDVIDLAKSFSFYSEIDHDDFDFPYPIPDVNETSESIRPQPHVYTAYPLSSPLRTPTGYSLRESCLSYHYTGLIYDNVLSQK